MTRSPKGTPCDHTFLMRLPGPMHKRLVARAKQGGISAALFARIAIERLLNADSKGFP
jgi:predicted HicB family RNase H-like nuclease